MPDGEGADTEIAHASFERAESPPVRMHNEKDT